MTSCLTTGSGTTELPPFRNVPLRTNTVRTSTEAKHKCVVCPLKLKFHSWIYVKMKESFRPSRNGYENNQVIPGGPKPQADKKCTNIEAIAGRQSVHKVLALQTEQGGVGHVPNSCDGMKSLEREQKRWPIPEEPNPRLSSDFHVHTCACTYTRMPTHAHIWINRQCTNNWLD